MKQKLLFPLLIAGTSLVVNAREAVDQCSIQNTREKSLDHSHVMKTGLHLTEVANPQSSGWGQKFKDRVVNSNPELKTPQAPVVSDTTYIGHLNAVKRGGICFIRNNEFGFLIDIGWNAENTPGIAAPDGSIHRIVFRKDDATIRFDWGRKPGSDCAMIRLVADRATTLKLEIPARPWHAFNTVVAPKTDRVIDGFCQGFRGARLPWQLNASVPLIRTGGQDPVASTAAFTVALEKDRPVFLTAGFGDLAALESVGMSLDAALARYRTERAAAAGPWGDFVSPICDNLNNSRYYSNTSKAVVHGIGHERWIIRGDADYTPYFVWDTSFNALLSSVEDPEGAKTTLRTLLSYQQPDGMLPQIANWTMDPIPSVNVRGSNPPVVSMCAWKLYERWPDQAFLAEIFPKLLRYHDWWPRNSDGNGNGLLEWGARGGFHDAMLMTGWDDGVGFEGGKMVGNQMDVDAVDLNALWSMDAEHLARMADVLGQSADADRLRAESRRTNKLMNEQLWNEDLGLYCHRKWDRNDKSAGFLTRITPMNFYPLICGAPEKARAKRILTVLTDPKRFWGKWSIPTVEYSDPVWPKQEYWHGHIWPPVNYLVWLGLKRYRLDKPQRELAERSVDLFMRNWTTKGTCNENYRSTDGSGDDIPHYTWGALLCQIGMEYFCDPHADGALTLTKAAGGMKNLTLRNIPSGGILYDVVQEGGKPVIRKSL